MGVTKHPNKFICIHGHFYQPPRENAWLEQIEIQESAAPFHDWNERITEECYATNAHARILNTDNKIVDITNNYERISFNMGPTLLSWMELHRPDTYRAILDGDKASQEMFDGHGSAIAQVYNHAIMPLASRRDKETQIIWGLYDFEQRFGRKSEGIWLAETAVDTETLECLADHGVKYTILAPNQAKRFREIGSKEWKDGINPNKPYVVNLTGGRSITVFFYNGDVSQGVAFKGLLNDGRVFAEDLYQNLPSDPNSPEILNIATDGESYGHHHRQGEMALAFCLQHLDKNTDAQLTNYGHFLSLHEPKHEAEIHDNSSWSCAHGVERWRSDCGCETGGQPGWNQKWRAPLREGLDVLKMKLDDLYEKVMSEFHSSPWDLRDRFIEVIFRSDNRDYSTFFKKHLPNLTEKDRTLVIRMLEMQRNAMYMYTSCGWFFNDVSGIETQQILQYADRAIQLAERESELDLQSEFISIIEKGKSNLSEMGSIKDIYLNHVRPKRMTLSKVGMHYAVHVLFSEDPDALQVFNYQVETEDFIRFKGGQQILCVGRAIVRSKVTLSVKHLSFAVVYIGNHHLVGGTSNEYDPESFQKLVERLKHNFEESQIAAVIYDIEKHFDQTRFSFFDLMKDEQKKILEGVVDGHIQDATNSISRISESNYSLLKLMRKQGLTIPGVLWQNLMSKLEIDLTQAIKEWSMSSDHKVIIDVLDEFQRWDIQPRSSFGFKISQALNQLISTDLKDLDGLIELLDRLEKVHLEVNLIELQNYIFQKLKKGENSDRKRLGQKIDLEVESISSSVK